MTMTITGTTKIYGVIADPVSHVGSPGVFNPFMRERGIDGVLVPLHIRARDLEICMRALSAMPNFKGACVTIPHKIAMAKLCDEIGKTAEITGAVNVVRFEDGRMLGDNFDGAGFIAGLEGENKGVAVAGKNILMIGAGGAGRAIAVALAGANVAALTLANRNRPRADDLAALLAAHFPQTPARAIALDAAPSAVAEADIIINATALGLKEGDALPVELGGAKPDAIVADVIPTDDRTAFLAAAEAAGLRGHAGKFMLQYQRDLLAQFMGMV